MQVIVSCVVEIPEEGADVNVMEGLVQDAGRRAMGETLNRAWQELQARAPECPRCASIRTVADGRRPYRLRTVFGAVSLMRARRRCRGCGAVFQPHDAALRAAGPGRTTAGLVAAALLASASWPFATAGRRRSYLATCSWGKGSS